MAQNPDPLIDGLIAVADRAADRAFGNRFGETRDVRAFVESKTNRALITSLSEVAVKPSPSRFNSVMRAPII
jgi:hypothetical protein